MWLFAIAFAESSFFPLPPDIVLVAMVAFKAKKWARFAGITTIASTVGGLFGYLIGLAFFEVIGQPLIEFYKLQDELIAVQTFFETNAFWAVFVPAFTLIPYKIFTIASGLFHINLWVFLLASVVGRGVRFYIVAYITKLYGKRVLDIVMKYFNIVSLVLIIALLIFLLI